MKQEWRDPPHLAQLFAALSRYQVCYVLFGTAGLIAYGARLSTGDLDICPAPDNDNLRRLAELLIAIQARPHAPLGQNEQEQPQLWRPVPFLLETFDSLFQTTLGDLDIVPFPYGPHGKRDSFTYEDLRSRALTKFGFGVAIPVAAFADLVASKLSARREKDLSALPEIERLRAERAYGKETGWPLVEAEMERWLANSPNPSRACYYIAKRSVSRET
ncbi:hypothetical protein EPA93_32070 [Ktedonosporobacter rubrisoli]|uniref:Nucleotidyltransferase family protein n=1 Tax=Ktedonosporobacter rubrisoli TaxID=2509675 RepID=A0A4P6JY58_KTERU|nr:hypothetical protein [Ktedonosporobacter rubrisoli]QBD80360.1 hypothetical protein EPA93_32070 [Ktedonosporobacter rubrisoli]